MKRLAPLMTLALAVLCAAPALSQKHRDTMGVSFASDSLTVPVMVNAPGRFGATFSTYVSIMNPTSTAFAVQVKFYDGAGNLSQATINLAAGELKTYTNFLSTVFSASGAGTVRFESGESVGGKSTNLFILTAEVYTTASGVRFGTTLPTLEFPGSDSRSFAAGVTVDASTRTNIGCFNESTVSNFVSATIFDGAGTQVGRMELPLSGNAWGQRAVNVNVSGGYIQFDPTAAASCYAVVVSNSTNDGRFVPAVEYTP